MKRELFIKRSRIDAPVEEVFQWHARPGALERLTPPWNPVRVLHRNGGIQDGGTAALKLSIGPIPVTWKAAHFDYHENRMFRDRQVQGPFSHWVHTHRFEPDGTDACILEDHLEYALPGGPVGHFLGRANVRQMLEAAFDYRHAVTAMDLADHLGRRDRSPLTVALTGASGVVGTCLIPFLTTGGHRVIRLVRGKPEKNSLDVAWDPAAGRLDADALAGVDVMVHLAGENIGEGRWTAEKKRRIIESRTRGTGLIARTAARMDPPPKVLICASAIGYYGDRCEETLCETDSCGADFISEVCDAWESAAQPAIDQGIRVVFLRIGIALSPLGGALARLLPLFRVGLGGKIGSGDQYMSWVGMDDVVGTIYHAIDSPELSGPVNVTAPHPVTNREFTRTLGAVLGRPTPFTVPEAAIMLAFGEMGREVPLSSTRVDAGKLLASGYRFRHPDLEGALRYLLGRKVRPIPSTPHTEAATGSAESMPDSHIRSHR